MARSWFENKFQIIPPTLASKGKTQENLPSRKVLPSPLLCRQVWPRWAPLCGHNHLLTDRTEARETLLQATDAR